MPIRDLRPTPGSIPTAPGVYRFKDADGRVIYVGKAKNLRSRLSSYFQEGLHPRTGTMVAAAHSVDWTVVANEVEALQLEYTWIKSEEPRFNVRFRDDKSYPYLAVTINEEFPRVFVTRAPKSKGVRYFGPYTHAWAIRNTLDAMLRIFPIRSCSAGTFKRAHQIGRPCLLGHIGKCAAPCVNSISEVDHRVLVGEFISFLSTDPERHLRLLEKKMNAAADEMDYEKAARIRDDIAALRRALESSAVVLADNTDADLIAVAGDELELAFTIFSIRAGRVRGERARIVERSEEIGIAGLMERVITESYGNDEECPKEILVSIAPENIQTLELWLSEKRSSRVEIRVPQRGPKLALMETVSANAEQALGRHRLRRSTDLTTRSQALAEIQSALSLPEVPLRIECFDISNLQGTQMVASMVVFEDGLPRKSEYRRFAIASVGEQLRGPDDTRAMHQVITRRLARLKADREAVANVKEEVDAGGVPRRFAYPPQLIVVDGGAPQVNAAAMAIDQAGEHIRVVGLAKRLEELWSPEDSDPVLLARNSEALYLLQRIRDEAHRFAIAYHRTKRSKAMLDSALDDIPGLGQSRRTALIEHFGSLRALADASAEEIAALPGIGAKSAATIHEALSNSLVGTKIDPVTGEILSED
ncbi:MAG TPA: excinuclease ABC subunit UvrC [Candidatus Nanopelagicaceae bacterium]|nr:excinuclease ABC subunit UvrC [Candidatus Nanopelagicaceae bacterium]